MEQYVYEPLKPGEFRLLKFISPDTRRSVNCTLVTASLGNNVPYACLSYCWGTSNASERIRIQGQNFAVTPNLKSALLQIQRRDDVDYLWVDAICINQADNVEKSVQVDRMGQIYSECSALLIWLGDADSDTGKTFELIGQVGHDYANADGDDFGDIGTRILNTASAEALGAFSRLQARPYFSRLWIQQELALSIDSPSCLQKQLLCGPFGVPYLHWALVIRILDTCNFETVQYERREALGDAGYRQDVISYSWQTAAHETTLAANLWRHTDKECSDPRDRVYALLNISSDVANYDLVPNYELDVRQLLCNCAALFIQRDKNINILAACRKGRAIHDSLPSWVPQWYVPTAYRTQKGLVINMQQSMVHRFRSGTSQAVHAEVSADLRYLKLRCLLLGVVNSMATPWIPPTEETLPEFRDIVNSWADAARAQHARSFDTRIPQDEAFVRTVLCDTNYDQVLFDDDYLALFELWAREGKNLSTAAFKDPVYWSKLYLEISVELSIKFRRFLCLEGGYMALGPADTEVDDVVAIPFGSQAPFVFRKAENDCYTLIGACYVHGVMEGEAFEEPLKGLFKTEDLTII